MWSSVYEHIQIVGLLIKPTLWSRPVIQQLVATQAAKISSASFMELEIYYNVETFPIFQLELILID
jgi:hypothetical protein